jgi:hypothetical protein
MGVVTDPNREKPYEINDRTIEIQTVYNKIYPIIQNLNLYANFFYIFWLFRPLVLKLQEGKRLKFYHEYINLLNA